MYIETIAKVTNNGLILNDLDIYKKFSPGQNVKVIIEDIADELLNKSIDDKSKLITLKSLYEFAEESDIITIDGMIKREDAYNGR
jgi:hypothetical protein